MATNLPHSTPESLRSYPSEIVRRITSSHNYITIRQRPWGEIAGAFGDIGTLVPLFIAMAQHNSISFGASLVFTGLANVLSGLIFGIPLPVQPMKAIAAVAIANQFTIPQTASAGLFVSVVIGLFSIFGILDWVARVVPIPVIKGIQVGAGLQLIISSGVQQFSKLSLTGPTQGDNLLWAAGSFLLLLYVSSHGSRFPYAFVMLLVGLVSAIFTLYDYRYNSNHPAPLITGGWTPHLIHPTPADLRVGVLSAGIGQLPLTALNSIVAVTHLSGELLPDVPSPSPRALGGSILVMNAIGCAFGALPACHGSGGLAGQYRFGARSGSAPIILGLVKLLLAVVFSERWLMELLDKFPKSILGVMVAAAGIELVKVIETLNYGARDLWELDDRDHSPDRGSIKYRPKELSKEQCQERWAVLIMTVAGLLAFKNDAVGFGAGLLCHSSLLWRRRWMSRRSAAVLPVGEHDTFVE